LRSVNPALLRFILKWIGFKPKNALVASRISRYNFHPKPYPGDVFLFKANKRPWYVRWDLMENWQKYVTGNLRIREVQGEHGSLLFEPNVRYLGQEVNKCLQIADTTQLPGDLQGGL